MAGRNKSGLAAIFGKPLILAAVSLIGLIAALLYDGPIDLLLGLIVAVPLVIIGFYWLRRLR